MDGNPRGAGSRGSGRGMAAGRGYGRGGGANNLAPTRQALNGGTRGRGRGSAPGARGSFGRGVAPPFGVPNASPYERPYGVWLPGLRRVAKLLNGTAGVKRVASSRVHKKLNGTGDDEGRWPKGDEAVASASGINGVEDRLFIRIDGTGNYGAHRLVATYENERGLRSQQLFVTCERGFSIAQLRDVLRALQPVLNFILDDGGDINSVPF